ncbi:MAG: VWA domain-containing protein [Acidobacteria bacterium]|nr:VWA domain-containing protein [Acidobacteriota bacterium]MBI3428436.1 VWA domain-containing protein [Acidobacteriota bacterium]
MKASRTLAQWLGTLALLFCVATLIQAQGIILPRPCDVPGPRCAPPEWQQPLRVRSIHLKTKITDQAAVTHVEQVFVNESPYTLEGTYFFPLPDGVSISEFAMWDGDKRLVGEFRAREEARRIYDNIVRTRRDPALLEYAGKNLFQASVFPIGPHSEKKIELTYSQVLTGDAGTVGYRYPLGTGWRANGFINDVPRPLPGPRPIPRPMPPIRRMQEDGEQDSTRMPQPRPNVGVVAGEIEIVSRIALKGIYSPSHEIEVKRDGERRARITFETRATSGQPDLQLFYTLSEQEFGASLLTYREPGKEGYFMLLLAPKAELDEKAVAAKEVVFVLDTSGSMADDGKLEKARAALCFGVNALNARDRFNIVSFAGEEHLLSERLLNADANGKKQALEFIERLKATGGTNINDALLAAFKQLPASERPQMVVLLTDGQPTVGTTSASKIMSNAKEANRSNARLFTFGVGYDINTLLLDGLAGEGRGAVTYIEPKEDIELKVSSFFSKVNYPVLSDLKLDWGGSETELLYPRALPDLFHGAQQVLVGRYRPKADFKLTLTGKVAGRERRFVYDDLKFPETERDHEFLAHLWAMRRVGHLLDQIRLNGENKELRDEIVALGTRYGIVTPYTSALVLEPGMQVSERMPMPPPSPRRANRADAGSGGRVMTEAVTIAPAAPMGATSGEAAVKASKQKAEMERSEVVLTNPSANDAMRQVAGKTFYLRDGVWTDSEFKADAKLPEVSLKFASDEYFKLINQTPKLADFFALGQRVTVVWQGKVYRVVE